MKHHQKLIENEEEIQETAESFDSPEIRRNHVDIGLDAQLSENYSVSSLGSGNSFVAERLHYISSKFESLDYDPCMNSLWLDEQRTKGYRFIAKKDTARWIVNMTIGVTTALVGCIIDITIEVVSAIKFGFLQKILEENYTNGNWWKPIFLLTAINTPPAFCAAILGAYVEPVAVGSGIPQVKCYLNGVKVPRIVRIKTLISKVVGVTCSVLGGLAVGKEGPMIHSGAVIAAGISQGKTTSFKYDLGCLQYFREDHEKRDFVSTGAAAGVAAAFGAPVGGVLFSLEEGASFWNQALTWRVFFGAMVSYFTLNLVLSAFKGQPGNLTNPGLLNFGKFDDLTYQLSELVPFLIMGAIGGFLGALFNYLNYKITVMRMKLCQCRVVKVIEVICVCFITSLVGYLMLYLVVDCRDVDTEKGGYPVQLACEKGKESTSSVLWLSTPEECVRSLFHDPRGAYGWNTVGIFFVVYFCLACYTYGLAVPSGLFIPTLLTGAAWGRLCGMLLGSLFPNQAWVDEGKYALVGAAAMLGGVVRMTISLTVILMECVGNITFGLPLMIVIIVSKWVGDFFNEGLYDIHIKLSGAPIIAWEPPPLSNNKYASEVMNSPVVTFNIVETVENIFNVLKNCPHNGFPVVDSKNEDNPNISDCPKEYGKLRGLILRSQLTVLLKEKVFNENSNLWIDDKVNIKLFRDSYPRFYTLDSVDLSLTDMECTIDLRPFMNPSPYTVSPASSLYRIFRLFRALGLRHLIVLSDEHQVAGMVTRKDIVKYRLVNHRGSIVLQELSVAS